MQSIVPIHQYIQYEYCGQTKDVFCTSNLGSTMDVIFMAAMCGLPLV